MNTNWQSLLIYDDPYDRTRGRAPRASELNAEEYTRRFVAWAAATPVNVVPLGTIQERADYYDGR